MTHKRVYHPETNEPFDVTPNRADHLILNLGWNQQPMTRVAVPAADPIVFDASDYTDEPVLDDTPSWRGTTGRRGRKAAGSDEVQDEA